MHQHERLALARRGFLSGLAALPVAAAVTAPAFSATAAEAVSPEVAELTRLYDAAQARTSAALAACEAAEARYVRPSIPEVLFQRPGEPLHQYVQALRGPDGRFWYGDHSRIEMLRGWSMDRPGWEPQHARRAEILAAYEAWKAEIEAAQHAAGMPAAEAEYSAAWVETEVPVRERIVALRSTEPAALALKVRVLIASVAANDWRADLDDKVNDAIEKEGGPWEDAFAASLLRDLVTAYAA